MAATDWRVLHEELLRCPWFSRVGQPTKRDGDPRIRRVGSWAEAIRWAEEENSWWCANEASNVLRGFLHVHYHQQYQEWNNHIAAFGPALDDLFAGPVTAALPPEARTPDVLQWIRSHLTRAYVECVYSPLTDAPLDRDQAADSPDVRPWSPPKVGTPEARRAAREELLRMFGGSVYSPKNGIRVVRDQVDWYLAGHFPCGWFVEDESEFPDQAVTIVY